MLFFLVFILIAPNFDFLYTFYMKDKLKFTDTDLANISSFGEILYTLSLVLYYTKLKHMSPDCLFLCLNVLSWLFSLSFLLVITGTVERLGWNVKYFCLFTNGFNLMFRELYLMPILAIWCGISPKNLEGVSVTLITGIYNMAHVLGKYLGAFFIWCFLFDKENYSDLWMPVVIDNGYLVVVLFLLLFVPFPDPRDDQVKRVEEKFEEGNTIDDSVELLGSNKSKNGDSLFID